jgi:hypothetical protein
MQKNPRLTDISRAGKNQGYRKMAKICSFGYSEKSLTSTHEIKPGKLLKPNLYNRIQNFSLLNASLSNFLTPFFLRPVCKYSWRLVSFLTLDHFKFENCKNETLRIALEFSLLLSLLQGKESK